MRQTFASQAIVGSCARCAKRPLSRDAAANSRFHPFTRAATRRTITTLRASGRTVAFVEASTRFAVCVFSAWISDLPRATLANAAPARETALAVGVIRTSSRRRRGRSTTACAPVFLASLSNLTGLVTAGEPATKSCAGLLFIADRCPAQAFGINFADPRLIITGQGR